MSQKPSGSNAKPRKSTQTQSQRNSKRQRATPEQCAILEQEFSRNQLPDQERRGEIAERIDMTERSVQIWFQNKRAKYKKATRGRAVSSGADNGSGCGQAPIGDSYHSIEFNNTDPILETCDFSPVTIENGIGLYAPEFDTATGAASFDAPGLAMQPMYNNKSEILLQEEEQFVNVPCTSLSIGGWSRISPTRSPSKDLTVSYSTAEKSLAYIIDDGRKIYKVLIPIRHVSQFSVKRDQFDAGLGHVLVHLQPSYQPTFYMSEDEGTTWRQTSDFSERKSATLCIYHDLMGPLDEIHLAVGRIYAAQTPDVGTIRSPDNEEAEGPNGEISSSLPERGSTKSTPPSIFGSHVTKNEDEQFCFSSTYSNPNLNLLPSLGEDSFSQHQHTYSNTTDASERFDTEETALSSPSDPPFSPSFGLGCGAPQTKEEPEVLTDLIDHHAMFMCEVGTALSNYTLDNTVLQEDPVLDFVCDQNGPASSHGDVANVTSIVDSNEHSLLSSLLNSHPSPATGLEQHPS